MESDIRRAPVEDQVNPILNLRIPQVDVAAIRAEAQFAVEPADLYVPAITADFNFACDLLDREAPTISFQLGIYLARNVDPEIDAVASVPVTPSVEKVLGKLHFD
jgi:hypothetical protein